MWCKDSEWVAGKTRNYSGSLDRTWKFEEDESGTGNLKESLKAGAYLRKKTYSLGADYTVDWVEGEESRKIVVLEGEYRPKGWEFSLRVKGLWEPDFKVQGKAEMAVSRPRMKAALSAELIRPLSPDTGGFLLFQETPLRFLRVSLYWKTRQVWN